MTPGSQILDVMNAAIAEPRAEVGATAPKIISFKIPMDKIGEVIGPKGKVINTIQQETGADINVDDDGVVGTVTIGSTDSAKVNEASRQIELIINPPTADVGQVYQGRVVNITKFGAFVNILPGRDGLVHISKLGGGKRINRVEDVVDLGDEIEVRVDDIDPNGKVSLTPVGPLGGDAGSGGGGSFAPSAPLVGPGTVVGSRLRLRRADRTVAAPRRRPASRIPSTRKPASCSAISARRPQPRRAATQGGVTAAVAGAVIAVAAGRAGVGDESSRPAVRPAGVTSSRPPCWSRAARRHRAHARRPLGLGRRVGRRRRRVTRPAELAGVSHFLEHLLFKGSERTAGARHRRVGRRGWAAT